MKSMQETPANVAWVPKCKAMLERILISKMREGEYGTAGIKVTFKDGCIQEAETHEQTFHRQKT